MKFQTTVTMFLCSYVNTVLGRYSVDPQPSNLGAYPRLSPVQGDDLETLGLAFNDQH